MFSKPKTANSASPARPDEPPGGARTAAALSTLVVSRQNSMRSGRRSAVESLEGEALGPRFSPVVGLKGWLRYLLTEPARAVDPCRFGRPQTLGSCCEEGNPGNGAARPRMDSAPGDPIALVVALVEESLAVLAVLRVDAIGPSYSPLKMGL